MATPPPNCQDVIIQTDNGPSVTTTLEQIQNELDSAEAQTFDDFAVFQDTNRAFQSMRERKLLEILSQAKNIIKTLSEQDQIQQRKVCLCQSISSHF